MLPFPLIYCDGYDLNLGEHVFPAVKYRLIHERLLSDQVAGPEDFVVPQPASDEDVQLVHDADYIDRLKNGKLSYSEILRLEIPFSPQMVHAVWLAAGGSILAARKALEVGAGINIGGGFHHAYPDHGEGFCAIHDVAIAIRRLQKDGSIHSAAVVDCDVHHGNGTAAIFTGDSSVFTLSLHQENNYPHPKPPSTMDIHLPDGIRDDEYLKRLAEGVEAALSGRPDLLCYVAGADPYYQDQLGGLCLTMDGLRRRDALVFAAARQAGVPVMVTLAGGYAARVTDTVQIHVNTVQALAEVFLATSH